ncbi:MAG: 30S ribosomal protein S1 [Deltaproteobacteria bacterium]|nr:30S ribosomal protein S1 [Deltaproteobacteria bacterium]
MNAAIWEDPDGVTEELALDSSESEADAEDERSFMEMFEESLKSIQEGKIVSGEIVQIDNEFVLVDIGYKSEGQIRINEFKDLEGKFTAKVGDTVEVLLVRKEDKDGNIVLSKEKAARVKIWDDIEKAYKDNETIKGKIISRVKGGLSVDVGLQAFLPGSQADLRPVKDLDTLVGVEHDFKIIKYERRQGNIVLSRRAVLEVERAAQREKVLENLEEGAVVEGAVTNITDYGLFIDLGGIDGLVHVTNIAWSKTGHPSELYQIGDQITVKVLSFDREKERVSLGIKQLTADPWTGIEEKYPVDAKIPGRIATLKKYGAFVELEEGVEGLVHISEMSWTRKVMHPSELFRVGDTVETMVLSMDVAKKRISLSVKQLEPNPWDVITEEYPIGAIIEGKIKNITDFGVFVGIDKGIDGLVHISDISWTKQIKHPSELYKKGDDVRAVILRIDKENEHFSLGIKHLTPDPWNEIPEKYRPGTRVSGKVTNITDFGLFVELEEGIEGLIHVSQLPKGQQDAKELKDFQVGDVLDAEVVNVSQKDKRIGLSIRKLQESPEKKVYTNYVNNQEKATSSLGALLKEKMMGLDSDDPQNSVTPTTNE